MIDDIQAQMGKLFDSRKLELFTIKLNLADMAAWADGVAIKRKLNRHDFSNATRELFWALGTIQLNLGHTLIALSECPYPSGTKGIALKGEEIPDASLADLHFWHHLYNCYEAIYRFWERCVTILKLRLTPRLAKKYYFDGYVNYLTASGDRQLEKEAQSLKRYLKSWGKISWKRNEISHGRSNPFMNMNIDVAFSSLADYRGRPIAKIQYELPNLKQEIETVINYYKKSHDLLYSVKGICDSVVEPSHALKGDLGDVARPSGP